MSYHDPHFTGAADSGRAIVESLGGRWGQSGGMCRCPAHRDRTPSLSVRLGRKRLLFHCFAGCDNGAVLQALHALRLPGAASWSPAERHDAPDDLSRRAAQQLWSDARAAAGSPAELYLAGRGIKPTPALRFHPRTPLGPKPFTRFSPAMIASVTDATGLIAVHRSFLSRDGRRLTRREPRRAALGRLGSGLVRLTPAAPRLGLAEGIETALSATSLFDLPCWATLGTERFSRIELPPGVEEIVLFLDHDAGGKRAEMLAREHLGRHVVEAHYPPCLGDDWNDVLRR